MLFGQIIVARLAFMLFGSTTKSVRLADFICSISAAEKHVRVGDFFGIGASMLAGGKRKVRKVEDEVVIEKGPGEYL